MLRIVVTAVALHIALLTHACACEGQVGKVIFEDTFADDSGGWELAPPVGTIKSPEFVITLDSKKDYLATWNLTFHSTDGDYCIEASLPKPIDSGNLFGINLAFWRKDNRNFFNFGLGSNGTAYLTVVTDGKADNIYTEANVPAFKSDPTAVNALRVIAKDGKLTLQLNGSKLKVVRAQVPEGSLRFGFSGYMSTGVDNAQPIRVKSFKVTAGE